MHKLAANDGQLKHLSLRNDLFQVLMVSNKLCPKYGEELAQVWIEDMMLMSGSSDV